MRNPYLEGRNYGSLDSLFQENQEEIIETDYQVSSYSNWENSKPVGESIAFNIFHTALRMRIQSGKYCGKTPDGKYFDSFSNLLPHLLASSMYENELCYYKSKLGGYFKELIQEHPKLLRFNLNDYIKNNVYYLDDWIIKYGIGYRRNVVSHENVIKKPIESVNKIEIQKPKVLEKQEVKTESSKIKELLECKDFDEILTQSTKGRPAGSKNKKPQKQICMPIHEVKIINDQIDEESLIKAVADLVWRLPGKKDKFYLDNLIMGEHHRKYVNQLFINQNVKIKNKFWKFKKSGDETVLIPICKRLGYYHMNSNKEYLWLTALKLSQITKIPESTLRRKLKYESIKEIYNSLKK